MSTRTAFAPSLAEATTRLTALATAGSNALSELKAALANPTLTTVMGNGFLRGPPVLDGDEQGREIRVSARDSDRLKQTVYDKLHWHDCDDAIDAISNFARSMAFTARNESILSLNKYTDTHINHLVPALYTFI